MILGFTGEPFIKRKLEDQYVISEPFAEGNFAEVRKISKKSNNEEFALKVISKNKVWEK